MLPTWFRFVCNALRPLFFIVKLFLDQPNSKDIDFNVGDDFGNTGLMLACDFSNLSPRFTDIVKMILDYAAVGKNIDVNARDWSGLTAFMQSCRAGFEDVATLFLTHLFSERIEFNAQDDVGSTAFIHACENRNNAIIELLLNHQQIDVNAKSDNGMTALMWICHDEDGLTDIVRTILEHSHRFDFNARDDNGNTGFKIACEEDEIEIVELLHQHATLKDIQIPDAVFSDTVNEILNRKTSKRRKLEKTQGPHQEPNQQKVQIIRTSFGKIEVRGLLPGQQLP